ncbi:hypothetical protein E8E14_001884 [Neopestalotiopsis sp. 37M]|nr:hypothetical protein E8E14_001884 [Neopestalotiopsis sp. 37M]
MSRSPVPPFRMLIFSKTAGYRHESIPAGINALKKFAATSGHIDCDASEDASIINPANLARYRVLVFLHTSGNFLEAAQLEALKGYVRGGGGFVGIHGTSTGGDDWFKRLVGAGFTNHPEPQDGVVKIEDPVESLTKDFPTEWKWHDEWYNFQINPRSNVKVLLSIDEKCYKGGTMGNDHPLAWYQEFEGGSRREKERQPCKTQNRGHRSTVADLGDLGNFCEESIQTWNRSHMQAPEFSITHRRDEEMMHYLQDALEVPYWDFMVSLFLGWRSNLRSLSGDVVLRVLHGVRQDLIQERHRLESEMASSGTDQQSTSFILEGIENRMKILDSVWYSTESELSLIRKSDSHLEATRQTAAAFVVTPSSCIQPQRKDYQSETVALISLVLVFLMAAIPPGYKAFALSMQDGTAGSINDADFWYLVQNSVMAVLGNIIMVVPLLRKSWFSPAYILMWVFFILGLAFACIAIAIYPLLNTGWSSLVSFFGSISSVASVLVMTQAAAKDARQDKIKAD